MDAQNVFRTTIQHAIKISMQSKQINLSYNMLVQ